jgi:hypothetical protein
MKVGRYPPLPGDHPLLRRCCGICGVPFRVGDRVALVSMGPGDPVELRKARDGHAYNARAEPVHERCPDEEKGPPGSAA